MKNDDIKKNPYITPLNTNYYLKPGVCNIFHCRATFKHWNINLGQSKICNLMTTCVLSYEYIVNTFLSNKDK